MKRTYYDLLQVTPAADPETIEAAFQVRARQLEGKHDAQSSAELKLVLWAHATLMDPARRAEYDRTLGQQANREAPQPEPTPPRAGAFSDWWNSRKLTAVLTGVFVLLVVALVLGFKKEDNKTDVSKMAVQEGAKNASRRLDIESTRVTGELENQRRAIDVNADLGHRELDRKSRELEYRAQSDARSLEMNKQAQEAIIALERQRQAGALERQRLQDEERRRVADEARRQREQRYWACMNLALDVKPSGRDAAIQRCEGMR